MTTTQSQSIWGKLFDKNAAWTKLSNAELNLSRAQRCNFPEGEIEQLRAEYTYRREAYRPYCLHDWCDMSTGQGDDVHEIVKCLTCGMDKEAYDLAHSAGVDVEDLLP
jgi:hypothetical protein